MSEFQKYIEIAMADIPSAMNYAKEKHSGQYRRGKDVHGNKIPYVNHPLEVGAIVWELKKSHKMADLVAAAYLHDTLEDSDATYQDIKEKFGTLVADLVLELTSDKEVVKEIGKDKYLLKKLMNMSNWGLVIKLADRLQNVSDLHMVDTKFRKKYIAETHFILDKLKNQRKLTDTQEKLVDRIYNKLSQYLKEL